jgi:ATP-dependent Clp protease ATP-binding subunit ClpA
MFERYTEKARRTIFFARYEASQFGSPTIETEHLLLGLMREDKALTNRFLHAHGSAESIRKQIEAHTPIREKLSTKVDLPLSNECKRVLAFATEEAERLGHEHIGTEHLLLGLMREEGGSAAQMLREREVDIEEIRVEVAAAPPGLPPWELERRRQLAALPPEEQEKIRQLSKEARARIREVIEGRQQAKIKPFPGQSIYDRCTEDAKQSLVLAHVEASQFGSPCIEVEHVLLGALRVGKAHLDLFLPDIELTRLLRAQVEEHTLFCEDVSNRMGTPSTTECRRAMFFAAEEADRLQSERIGPEHLLLGILREEHSFAARILRERGAELNRIRKELATPPHEPSQDSAKPGQPE